MQPCCGRELGTTHALPWRLRAFSGRCPPPLRPDSLVVHNGARQHVIIIAGGLTRNIPRPGIGPGPAGRICEKAMEGGASELKHEPEPEPEPEPEAQPQPEPEPKAASGSGAAAQPPSRTEEPSSATREGRAPAEGAPQAEASSADGKQKQTELDDAGSWGRGIDCPKIWCARLLSLVLAIFPFL